MGSHLTADSVAVVVPDATGLALAAATPVEVEAMRVAMLVVEPRTTMVKTKVTKAESTLAMGPLPLISCKETLRKYSS